VFEGSTSGRVDGMSETGEQRTGGAALLKSGLR